MIDAVALGALPMANVLAVALVIGYRRHGSGRFLLGFEAFGAVALSLYVVVAIFFTEELVVPYINLALDPLLEYTDIDFPHIEPIIPLIELVMLGLPQLAFSLIGGFLSPRGR